MGYHQKYQNDWILVANNYCIENIISHSEQVLCDLNEVKNEIKVKWNIVGSLVYFEVYHREEETRVIKMWKE